MSLKKVIKSNQTTHPLELPTQNYDRTRRMSVL